MTPQRVGRSLVPPARRLTEVRAGIPGTADPDDAMARVAWSAIIEPGDAVAGLVVDQLGASRAFSALLRGVDQAPEHPHRVLLELCGGAGLLPDDDPEPFERALVDAVARWRPRAGTLDVDAVIAAAIAVDATLILPDDDEWPGGIDDLGPHRPMVLWQRGRAVSGAALAVVGSRANTVTGAEVAAEIASAAADAGCAVVSGGAYGIDAVAHRVALSAGTPTVAVLAGGVDQLYPAGHVELLRAVARDGAVLAESPPGTRPTRWRFLARNRLIAALADATVVVEAGARSGALNTAHHAAQLGRPVFAVPGPLTAAASVGCHRLIATGRAEIVVHPRDPADAVRRASGGAAGPDGADPPALGGAASDPLVVRVLDALDRRRPLAPAELARRSGMSELDVTGSLALAELQGLVRREPSGWLRS